jgi:hypothetical protein
MLVAVAAVLPGSLPAAQPPGTPVAPGPVLVVPAAATALEVAVPLPADFQRSQAKNWQLVELGTDGVALDAQRVPALAADGEASETAGQLVAVIPPRAGAKGSRRFRLQAVKLAPRDAFAFKDVSDKSVQLLDAGQPVLTYNHGTITREDIPEREHRRSRACYVHPVYGLRGEVLTDDFPRDHYHHHGIFWTWPHVKVDGREHDLWLGNTIHQKFVRWIAREAGPVCGVLAVENGWFVGEKKVMIERVWLRAYPAVDGNSRALDVELTFTPTDKPVTLWGAGGKSYGGLTVRFAPGSREETLITVPDGKTTRDLPDTPLAWADFTSKFKGAEHRSGAAVMVSPEHPDFPPTWLTRHYGPLCVGWPGVKPKTFPPGVPIRMSYRIWIHKDPVEPEVLRAAYEAYEVGLQQTRWNEDELGPEKPH